MYNYPPNCCELSRLKKVFMPGNHTFTLLRIALIVSMTFTASCAAPKRASVTAGPEKNRTSANARMVVQLTHANHVSAMDVSADGHFIVSAGWDKTVRLWNIKTGHENAVTSVAFCHDGHTVVTGSQDATARIWNALQGTQYGNAISHTNGVTVVDTSGEETVFFTAAGEIPQAWSLDLSSGIAQHLLNFEGNSDWVSAVDFSPDGKRLLIGTWDDTARLWDAGSGAQLQRLQGHTGDVRGVTFSPDGQWIVTAARDGTARIWQTANGLEFHRLTGHKGGIRPVVFSADGRWIVTGGDDGTARVWDRQAAFSQVSLLGPHEDRVSSVAFSPDGRRVVTASKNMVRLWDVATQRIIRAFNGHTRLVNTVTFSPDGRRILSAGWDQIIRLWDARSGTELLNFEGHTNGIHSAVFSRDGSYVATGSEDKTICLWDPDSGKQLRCFTGHTSAVIQVAFSPDNRFLLSASADQTARLWDTATGEELCQLISFRDGGWAVVDKKGRFDASNGGDVEGLHWVVGLEAIALSQLKERYYEPGLLAKKMGYNREPLRNVVSFVAPGLFPDVITKPLDPRDPKLQITLVNRGGGIGRAIILLNGKEIISDARGGTVDPSAEQAELPPIPLAGHPYLLAGQKNVIEVRAYNAEGFLSSRGVTIAYLEPGTAEEEKPVLWAIVAGVSDYAGNAIDLRYAAKDAEDMAHALEIGGTRLFGADHVRLTLLITSDKPGQDAPTRERLQSAFEAAAQARATDLLLVYLAGHGVTYGGQDGDFYYLTPDAGSGNIDDPAIRASVAISSMELTEMIRKVPALKQILILDTCASGRVVERLTEKRDIASSQVRALERMKDRTGLYVLAGAAADAVSYEAGRYGQGLLTWSLLFGMRGAALREFQFVYVDAADFPDAYSLAGRYWVKGNLVNVMVMLFKEDIQKASIAVSGDITRLNRLAADIIDEVGRTLATLPG